MAAKSSHSDVGIRANAEHDTTPNRGEAVMNVAMTERSTVNAIAITSGMERDLREYGHEDVGSGPRRREMGDEFESENVASIVERVAGASIQEIDNLIEELHAVREYLLAEGERVQRELTAYAQATQTALASVRIMVEDVGEWKNAAGATGTQRR